MRVGWGLLEVVRVMARCGGVVIVSHGDGSWKPSLSPFYSTSLYLLSLLTHGALPFS